MNASFMIATRNPDGLPSVEAACAEAIAQGIHSADVVLNILSRQRPPGRARPEPLAFEPFQDEGFLDGQVVELNARSMSRSTPGSGFAYRADRESRIRLGDVIDGPDIPAHGTGKWLRLGDGTWKLQEFEIVRLEILDDKP